MNAFFSQFNLKNKKDLYFEDKSKFNSIFDNFISLFLSNTIIF